MGFLIFSTSHSCSYLLYLPLPLQLLSPVAATSPPLSLPPPAKVRSPTCGEAMVPHWVPLRFRVRINGICGASSLVFEVRVPLRFFEVSSSEYFINVC